MKSTKPVRVLAPEGQHVARIVSIVYLGTVKSSFGDTFKMRMTWELPNETHKFKDGEQERPFVVSKETSLSMGKKSTLRPIVEGMIGTSLTDEEAYDFDLDDLLGKECQVHIVHEETENGKYANVKSVSPLLKGVNCPPAFNKPSILSYERWSQDAFDALPGFLKDKMMATPEYKKLKGGKVEEANDESIPF